MRKTSVVMIVLVAAALTISCGQSEPERIVDVVAEDFSFTTADSIPSGWNRFNFRNAGHTDHFFLLNRIPDSISFDRYLDAVPDQFQVVFDSLKAGMSREDAIALLVESVPSWYFTDVSQMGGSGIVRMGDSQFVTLNLPAGQYVMECYIKEQGIFHTTLGMIESLTVTDSASQTQAPNANIEVNLSNSGMEYSGVYYKGRNTFAVHYLEHPELGLGNDIHIVKLDDDTDLDKVIEWLDWMNLEGLQSPSPAHFVGGVQEMPVGATSYFTVLLGPGEYAMVSESVGARELVTRFTVE